MTDKEIAADFQGDPEEIPMPALIFCGAMIVLALALVAPFAWRWITGQS